jgi:hypothetical protein
MDFFVGIKMLFIPFGERGFSVITGGSGIGAVVEVFPVFSTMPYPAL